MSPAALRIRTTCLLAITLAVTTFPVAAADLQDCIRASIPAHTGWFATFRQSQHIAVLSAPLEAAGEVELRDGAIRWTVISPMRQTLRIDADGHMHSDDGTPMDHPAVAGIVKMLLSLDLEGLQRHFVIAGTCDAKGWTLQLRPREDGFANLFSAIEVNGRDRLDAVVLQGRDGDFTRITFDTTLPGSPAIAPAKPPE